MKIKKEMKSAFGVIWSFVLLLLLGGQAFATTYYVSPSGNDSSSGNSSTPFKNIQKAADLVKPGDMVIVKDGVYTDTNGDDRIVSINRSGTVANWITFKAENKWGAVLDGQANATDYGFVFSSGSNYIKVEGLEVKGVANNGFHSNSQSHDIYLYSNKIHDIGRLCTSMTNGRSGVFQGRGTSYHTYDSNIFYTIGRLPGCGDLSHLYQHDHGIYAFGSNNTFINNIFYDLKAGWGIQLSGGKGTGDGPNWNIINNTFVGANPGRDGHIAIWTESGGNRPSNIKIENNISYMAAKSFVYFVNNTDGASSIRNNLLYGATKLVSASFSPTYNASNNIMGQNPNFVDTVNYDFHLQSGSPAINKGVYIDGYDYDADGNPIVGAPDIGAYEYGSSTASPTSPSKDTTAPSVPTGLTAAAVSTSEISLAWKASTDNTGVSGYKVYRGTTLIATTTTTSYVDTGLASSTEYTYKVSAFDSAGNVSSQSTAASTTTKTASATSPVPSLTEIIVDNSSSGTSYSGTWSVSGAKDPYGTNSLYGRSGATYSWKADLPMTGTYKVYIWWTEYPSRSANAPVTVNYNGGSKTINVNQQLNGGQWNYLGTFSFDASKGGTVKLSAPDGSPTSYSADAVKFVLSENLSAQSTSTSAITKTPVPQNEIIVDNSSSGTSYSGTWNVSGAKDPHGTNSLYGRSGATYSWKADLPMTGTYKVYIWWTEYPSRSTNAPVTVYYNGGSKTINVNQQVNGGQWNYLETFSFDASKGGTVKLSAPDGSPTSYSADAVKFVLSS